MSLENELKGPVRLSDTATQELVSLRDSFIAEMKRIDEAHNTLEQQRAKVKQEYIDAAFDVARKDIDLADGVHFAIDQEYLDQGCAFAKPCPNCTDTGSFRSLGDILAGVLGKVLAGQQSDDGDGDTVNALGTGHTLN